MTSPVPKQKLTALLVDDVVPPFLAKKLELCRKLGDESPTSPSSKGGSFILGGNASSPTRRVKTPDAIVNPEMDNLRKKDAFVRNIFNSNKLNHRQKEHIAANILLGKDEVTAKAPVFWQRSGRMSPSRVGNIETDGHRQRHQYSHRCVELVGGSVDIPEMSVKELKQKQITLKQKKSVTPKGFIWANEYIPAVEPYKLEVHRSFEGVTPSQNREYIVDAISRHNTVKAKRNAEQVRSLKAIALEEKSHLGEDILREVAIKKKLKTFRRKLHVYLEQKGEKQRGDIMRCIDEETIFTFMENFKGYSMSPDAILSLLGASLGASMSEGSLLVPDVEGLSCNKKSGYLPVQSSYQELTPSLRELHTTSPTEETAHTHNLSSGFTPHVVPISYSKLNELPKPNSNTANGFKVIPRPTSRMGSGFTLHRGKSKVDKDKGTLAVANNLSVAGDAVKSPSRTAPICDDSDSEQKERILISGEVDKSTWLTEMNTAIPQVEPIKLDTEAITDSFNDLLDEATPLIPHMRRQMAAASTLPSLFPEKVLTDEELIGLGNKTMTFEEIALKREQAASMLKRSKKPVTGLAGLKSGKGFKAVPASPVKTAIPRFIRTPNSGGEDFFPKSPNPEQVPVEHFGDDC